MLQLRTVFATNGTKWRERKPSDSKNWYAIALLADSALKVHRHAQTVFVGFSPDRPNRELRRASFVKPEIWREIMTELHETPLTVDDEEAVQVWLLLGGEALVESSLAEKLFPKYLETHEVGRIAAEDGWVSIKDMPASALRHAPTPKLRVTVLLRDRRRCRLCGRSPDNDPHAHLEAHHGIPWGRHQSGLTVEENLFTLCSTCHKGITNELEQSLVDSIVPTTTGKVDASKRDYVKGVFQYRRSVLSKLKSSEGREGGAPNTKRRCEKAKRK